MRTLLYLSTKGGGKKKSWSQWRDTCGSTRSFANFLLRGFLIDVGLMLGRKIIHIDIYTSDLGPPACALRYRTLDGSHR